MISWHLRRIGSILQNMSMEFQKMPSLITLKKLSFMSIMQKLHANEVTFTIVRQIFIISRGIHRKFVWWQKISPHGFCNGFTRTDKQKADCFESDLNTVWAVHHITLHRQWTFLPVKFHGNFAIWLLTLGILLKSLTHRMSDSKRDSLNH